MALIKCPECGRNNISDSADICPECGYAVKKHFENEKRKAEEALKQLEFEKQKRLEWEELQSELNWKLKEIDNLSYPKKPSLIKQMFKESGWLSYATIIALLASLFLISVSPLFAIILFILLMFWSIFWIALGYSDYKMFLGYYQDAVTDWEGYKAQKKEDIKKEYETYADNLARYGSRSVPSSNYSDSFSQSNALKCPICGATNVERISTMDRSVSVAMVGLASGKIGKQYKCKKCKHMW